MDKQAIKEAGEQIASVADKLPTRQMFLDLCAGVAARLDVHVGHIKMAVHKAQKPGSESETGGRLASYLDERQAADEERRRVEARSRARQVEKWENEPRGGFTHKSTGKE